MSELKWTIREYQGTEVFKYLASDHPEKGIDPAKFVPMKAESDLQVGDEIAVPGLVGGYHLMTVEKGESGGLFAKNEKLLAILEFGKDDRNAWVCGGLINTRGLAKLKVTT